MAAEEGGVKRPGGLDARPGGLEARPGGRSHTAASPYHWPASPEGLAGLTSLLGLALAGGRRGALSWGALVIVLGVLLPGVLSDDTAGAVQ